jgi:hypothetical protein
MERVAVGDTSRGDDEHWIHVPLQLTGKARCSESKTPTFALSGSWVLADLSTKPSMTPLGKVTF